MPDVKLTSPQDSIARRESDPAPLTPYLAGLAGLARSRRPAALQLDAPRRAPLDACDAGACR